MYPRGWPGLALMLLRVSVAAALLLEACLQRLSVSVWLQAAAIVAATTLLAGFMTPLSALLSLALHILIWLTGGFDAWALVIVIDAVALALLGPGAYSVDSRRYGHRIVVLPPSP